MNDAGRFPNFTWIVGVAAVLLLAYITLNTLRTDAPGSRGLDIGTPLPPFAAVLATGPLPDADANIRASLKNQGSSAGKVLACSVREPGVLNSCALAESGPVALVFFATRSARCEDQVDVVQRAAAAVPGVRVAAVAIRGTRKAIRAAVHEHGWTLPVAWDRDGAVSNLYAVAVCPTVTFAAHGKVVATTLGSAGVAPITAKLRAAASATPFPSATVTP